MKTIVKVKQAGRIYEKVCSFIKETNNLIFFPQTQLKVIKKKIDKSSLLNKPAFIPFTDLDLKTDLYKRAKIKADIQRKQREKLQYWNNKLVDFYEVDIPILNNFFNVLYSLCSHKEKETVNLKSLELLIG